MLQDKPLRKLVDETSRVLNKGVSEGITDNEPPAEMLDKLRNDVFLFSGCKTHAELKEASGLLTTEDGKIKPLAQFTREVQAIHKTYNEQYLEAEYQFATQSAQMAAHWSDFEKESDRYDLQYRTAGDSKVRNSHRVLALITLPFDDPFWEKYYPLNGWRCRCFVVLVRKGKYQVSNSADAQQKGELATTQLDKNGNNSAEIFRFNPGKQRVIFPPKHPYRQVSERVNNIIGGLKKSSVEKTEAAQNLVKWYKNNLPTKKVGKFEAKRFEVQRIDLEEPIIVNSTFYKEIISKYKTDKSYVEKLELAKQAHVFIQQAEFLHSEPSKHAKASVFKVYQYDYNGTLLELKCKVNEDGIYLYYMKHK